MSEIMWVILGMAVVTAVPRVVPALLVGRIKLSPAVKRWLEAIPYAALGALIFPGILTVDETRPMIGLIGGATAVLLAWLRLHLLFVVGGAIAVVAVLKGMT
jgi:branched-subunit amino acid transport protein